MGTGARHVPREMALTGLPPVVARHSRVLILGSFPGVASLKARQYYAHPQNRFWPILGEILAVDLHAIPYRGRIAQVKSAGIAIWDAYARCERAGSLDSAILDAEFNDFARLLKRAPRITRVCFNGAAAGRAVKHLAGLGLETIILPSTSPANASQSYEFKLARWRAALGD